ncbi:FUSC family protein [Turneriella parva]|uniref:Membrane protein n=1 Tax=Turneriella parva (strain ATCC BAA-1111 / DSM 21527 / NCTC 11395 / H) TaxID=869212 RepID=I4B1M3_TURPD|nr:FUSC family protein [Turneriella parva]AFM11180.1 membrane protein [Turneriella parva DSM 21527]
MTPQKRNTAIYLLKMVIAVSLCYLLSLWVSQVDYIWALISAVLVMTPEGKDAVQLSVIRIKGNIIGVLVGVLFLFAALENPVNIIAGATVALFACHRLQLMAGARSTLVALIITLMQTDSTDHWGAAVSRVAAVVAGCAIALFATHLVHNVFKLQYGTEANG